MELRNRFILRYTGDGPTPAAHVAHLRSVPGTKVLDESEKMLLVEGRKRDLETATHVLGGWVLTAEKTIPVPDARKRIRNRSR